MTWPYPLAASKLLISFLIFQISTLRSAAVSASAIGFFQIMNFEKKIFKQLSICVNFRLTETKPQQTAETTVNLRNLQFL